VPALFRRFPELEGVIPWRALGTFPTPVAPAPSLGDGIWIKREDRSSPAYGGNKVRKLEFLLGDALARGRRSVMTLGGTGSNHVLATAVHARALGMGATRAVLFPQPHTDEVTHKVAAHARLGIVTTRAAKPLVPFAMVQGIAAAFARGAGVPYMIPPGGSSPVGTLGYVSAGLELAEQIAAGALPVPDLVYAPLGSGGTVAGLMIGLRLAGLATKVVGVQVVPAPWVTVGATLRLANRTAALLARHDVKPGRFTRGDLRFVADQLGPGYGSTTDAATRAVARAAQAGVPLETTYSGKALAALLADGERGLLAGQRVLFLATYFPYVGPA
jgi:D-cysteine desulfhydrase